MKRPALSSCCKPDPRIPRSRRNARRTSTALCRREKVCRRSCRATRTRGYVRFPVQCCAKTRTRGERRASRSRSSSRSCCAHIVPGVSLRRGARVPVRARRGITKDRRAAFDGHFVADYGRGDCRGSVGIGHDRRGSRVRSERFVPVRAGFARDVIAVSGAATVRDRVLSRADLRHVRVTAE